MSERTIDRRDINETRRLFLQTGSTLEDVAGGVRLTRRYKCHRDLVASDDGANLPKEGDVDFRHRSLEYARPYLVDYAAEVATITVSFTGFIGRAVRVLTDEDWDVRVQETTFTGLTSGIQIGAVYLSPIVTVSYASDTRPGDEDRPAIIMQNTTRVKIKHLKGTTGAIAYGVNPQQILRNPEFGVEKEVVRTAFPRRKVGGLWMCTETIEMLLVQRANFLVL